MPPPPVQAARLPASIAGGATRGAPIKGFWERARQPAPLSQALPPSSTQRNAFTPTASQAAAMPAASHGQQQAYITLLRSRLEQAELKNRELMRRQQQQQQVAAAGPWSAGGLASQGIAPSQAVAAGGGGGFAAEHAAAVAIRKQLERQLEEVGRERAFQSEEVRQLQEQAREREKVLANTRQRNKDLEMERDALAAAAQKAVQDAPPPSEASAPPAATQEAVAPLRLPEPERKAGNRADAVLPRLLAECAPSLCVRVGVDAHPTRPRRFPHPLFIVPRTVARTSKKTENMSHIL